MCKTTHSAYPKGTHFKFMVLMSGLVSPFMIFWRNVRSSVTHTMIPTMGSNTQLRMAASRTNSSPPMVTVRLTAAKLQLTPPPQTEVVTASLCVGSMVGGGSSDHHQFLDSCDHADQTTFAHRTRACAFPVVLIMGV